MMHNPRSGSLISITLYLLGEVLLLQGSRRRRAWSQRPLRRLASGWNLTWASDGSACALMMPSSASLVAGVLLRLVLVHDGVEGGGGIGIAANSTGHA